MATPFTIHTKNDRPIDQVAFVLLLITYTLPFLCGFLASSKDSVTVHHSTLVCRLAFVACFHFRANVIITILNVSWKNKGKQLKFIEKFLLLR